MNRGAARGARGNRRIDNRCVVVGALLAAAACSKPPPAKTAAAIKAATPARTPPALTLVAPDLMRHWLTATVTIPALERSLPAAVALAGRATPLPLDPEGVKALLLSQTGLPPDVALNVDLTAPIGAAVVARDSGRQPAMAFAFSAKDAAGASALIAALGQVQTRRGAAVQVQNARGERAWFMQLGKDVVFADSDEALARAGGLALEARRPGPDDVTVTVFPDALARAAGTDVKTAVAQWRDQVIALAGAAGHSISPEAQDALAQVAEYGADIARADFGVHLDADRGAVIAARLQARTGSSLETLAHEVRPVPIDARLFARSNVGFAASSGYGRPFLDQLRRQRTRLATAADKKAVAAERLLAALEESLTGEGSATGSLRPTLAGEVIYRIRDAAGAKRIREALAAADKPAVAVLWSAALPTTGGSEGSVLSVRREGAGKARVVRGTFRVPKSTSESMEVLHRLFGADAFDIRAAVVDDERLVLAIGKDGRKRVAEIAGGTMGKPGGPFAEAMAAAGERTLFVFVDVAEFLELLGSGGAGKAGTKNSSKVGAKGATTARVGSTGAGSASRRPPMPLFGGVTGDARHPVLTVDLTITPACFAGVGTVLQGALMPR